MNGIHNQHEEHCLDIEVLIAAYTKGIFPMAESQFEEKIFWVEPKYRGVIPLDNFHSSRSLERHIRRYNSVVKYNKDFDLILNGCAKREQTWINPILKDTYKLLHEKGYAHSVGVFEDNKLVGGLFGIGINGAFFGESMYSNTPNASKIALKYLIERLKNCGYELFDTQFISDHLVTLGAIEIKQEKYLQYLKKALKKKVKFAFY